VRYLVRQLKKDPLILARPLDDRMLSQDESAVRSLVILDSCVLEVDASEYVRSLRARFCELMFVVLDHGFENHVLYRLLALGAQGFLTYDEVPEFLALAIHSVYNGGTWVDSSVLQKYMKLDRRKRDGVETRKDECLTVREEEILHLARQRLSNKEIGSTLGIGVSTVKFHLSNVFSKMNVAGRSDLWRNFAQGANPQMVRDKRPESVRKASTLFLAEPSQRSMSEYQVRPDVSSVQSAKAVGEDYAFKLGKS
jgi:DNA-binding NarL/FixJ family response regulator